jgi:DNA-binding NtrC family response regulator
MKKRILIVDDDEVNILSESKRLVLDYGVPIDIAESIEEAITLLKMREYEFVIIGCRFANSFREREFEILEQIKQSKVMTGIILLIGYGDTKVIEEVLSIGASYFYEKRVSTKILSAALKKCNRGSTI